MHKMCSTTNNSKLTPLDGDMDGLGLGLDVETD